jgi:hypothetical protein
MNRNPYAAPEATVADPVERPGQRPTQVSYAVRLLWVSVAISLIASLLNFQTLQAQAAPLPPATVLLIILISPALLAWITSRVAARRNWARRLFLVLTALGMLLLPLTLHATLALWWSKPAVGVPGVVNWVLQLVALGLLFTPRAGAWFRANRGP